MQLNDILNNITNIKYENCTINNITLDSRLAKDGFLFCAVKGQNIDARKFIPQTINNGVSAIIAHSDSQDYVENVGNTQIIYITDLSHKLSKIAANFYHHPTSKMQMVGITGTNGKTTISQLISQWTTILNKKAATMGTIGNGIYGNLTESENTTGSALDIQTHLSDFYSKGADITTMEVSSHGLDQGRVEDINFDVAIFTNLTQDHLDYHITMDNYFKAKSKLFTQLTNKAKIINIDDDYGVKLYNLINDKSTIITTGHNNNLKAENYIKVVNTSFNNDCIIINIESNFGNAEIKTHLVGEFNVNNVIQAFAGMLALGFSFDELCKTSINLKPVIGRMEVFTKENKPTAVVDYAHTHDALEKALEALKIHKENNIWCIFGCGGDRDKGKRPLMAQVAEQNADFVIITNDNPRTENDDEIIQDILKGLKTPEKAIILKDREQAIKHAIDNAESNDIILIAGKGHEDYQVIGTEKIHCCDREITTNLLNN